MMTGNEERRKAAFAFPDEREVFMSTVARQMWGDGRPELVERRMAALICNLIAMKAAHRHRESPVDAFGAAGSAIGRVVGHIVTRCNAAAKMAASASVTPSSREPSDEAKAAVAALIADWSSDDG